MPRRIFYFQIPCSLACLCYPFEKELMGFQLSYNDVLIFSRRYHKVVVQLEEIDLWQITEISWPVKRRNPSHGSVELKIILLLNTIFIICWVLPPSMAARLASTKRKSALIPAVDSEWDRRISLSSLAVRFSQSRYFKTIFKGRRISLHRNVSNTPVWISRRVIPSLTIMFVRLLFQYGAGYFERVNWTP